MGVFAYICKNMIELKLGNIKFTLIWCLLLLSKLSFGQHDPKIAKDSLVWKKKKQITWNDKDGKIINSLSFNCFVFLSYDAVKNKKVMSQPSRVKVNFDYDRKRDYTINDDPESSDYLFSQTVLNIHQLYAKKLRKACFKLQFKPGYYGLLESAFTEHFEQMQKRDNDMRLETENGKNLSKLTEWAQKISDEMEAENKLDMLKIDKNKK